MRDSLQKWKSGISRVKWTISRDAGGLKRPPGPTENEIPNGLPCAQVNGLGTILLLES
jgi:hypothetical protein